MTSDVFGDLLTVVVKRGVGVDTSLIGHLAGLRGLDQIMVDMCDRPEWVHQAMGFMTEATLRQLDRVEEIGLDLNNGDDYVGSGGVGYTDDLPAPGFDGEHVRLRDLLGLRRGAGAGAGVAGDARGVRAPVPARGCSTASGSTATAAANRSPTSSRS